MGHTGILLQYTQNHIFIYSRGSLGATRGPARVGSEPSQWCYSCVRKPKGITNKGRAVRRRGREGALEQGVARLLRSRLRVRFLPGRPIIIVPIPFAILLQSDTFRGNAVLRGVPGKLQIGQVTDITGQDEGFQLWESGKLLCRILSRTNEPKSKLLVSPLTSPIIIPYIIAFITPSKEFRL